MPGTAFFTPDASKLVRGRASGRYQKQATFHSEMQLAPVSPKVVPRSVFLNPEASNVDPGVGAEPEDLGILNLSLQ